MLKSAMMSATYISYVGGLDNEFLSFLVETIPQRQQSHPTAFFKTITHDIRSLAFKFIIVLFVERGRRNRLIILVQNRERNGSNEEIF